MKTKAMKALGEYTHTHTHTHTQYIPKHKFLNGERGSITLAVFVAMMFFSLFGAVIFGTATRKYKIQSNNIETIEKAYSFEMTDEELYRLYDNIGAQKVKNMNTMFYL